MVNDEINNLIATKFDEVVALRRRFHEFPEISGKEFITQQTIMKDLQKMGLEPQPIADTGVIVNIRGNRPGKTVAIRADMDALPIHDECGHSYQSQLQGVCHACGHDGHMAIALGVARVLQQLKNDFAGEVRLLFQPSEEAAPGGAGDLIEAGALAGVDYIIGAHLWQPLQTGTIGIARGKMLAAVNKFTIKILGKGGHGSLPHQTVDPILVATQLALALHTIVSRNIDPLEAAVLSLGMIKAGDAFNIIPDTAVIEGTVRCFEQGVMDSIFQRIDDLAKGICAAYGASYQLERRQGPSALKNTPEVVSFIQAAGREVLGQENVIEVQPVMISDDYALYLHKVAGAYFFVGCGNKEKGIIYPHHHPKFDIDETGLKYGVEIMTRAALKLLA
ncbi:MAG: amidohydrolase [Firmicutes bacterium]|nr:amidohydrolase [Bacillota bacterium]